MNFHHCLFKILKKNQNVTDRRTDNVKTVYPPTNIVCRGYKQNGCAPSKDSAQSDLTGQMPRLI